MSFNNILMIIDGNSLAYRAFYALPSLYTSNKVPTNAIHGFLSMLFKITQKKKPEMLAICFDKGKFTFRNKLYTEYKGTRKETPTELRQQFPLLKEILKAMNIFIIEKEGFEADDLIGSLSFFAEKKQLQSLIVTGDKDALQLISPFTKVLLTAKGISILDEYDYNKVFVKYGIKPLQLIDYKGLTGDKSDNIPGVPGIGDKGASSLIQKYGSLEETLMHSEELTPKLKSSLVQYSEQALLSKKLATIVRDLELNIDFEELRWEMPSYEDIFPLFSELELNSHLKTVASLTKKGQGENNLESLSIEENLPYFNLNENLNEVEKELKNSGYLALAIEENFKQELCLAFYNGENSFYLNLKEANLESRDFIKNICSQKEISFVCHDAKEKAWLLKREDMSLNGIIFDTMIASYLLNPSTSSRTLEEISLKQLEIILPSFKEQPTPSNLIKRAKIIYELYPFLKDNLIKTNMDELYFEVELPLIEVLTSMEMEGVKIDLEQLRIISLSLEKRLNKLTQDIYHMAGENFNLNSPKQLAHILFEKLELPILKKTKTGASTDAQVLNKLSSSHKIVAYILEYRQLSKLKNTYVDGLPQLIEPKTSLIHTTFHQDVTATGRLSSAEPNLQNIPVRSQDGREIRKCFLPKDPQNIFVSADYSQIELRILAHLSKDPLFVKAFKEDKDIHTITASEIFSIPIEDVSPELRKQAKAINFGIIYGMGANKLAQETNISFGEAKKYINNYFKRYQGIKIYIEETIKEASQRGYVCTLLNRRRYIPELKNSNKRIYSLGERTAINTPIQGTASDIIKMAMVYIFQKIKESNLKSRLILQVHDELIFEVVPNELSLMQGLIKEGMEKIVALDIPLTIELQSGDNWYNLLPILS